MAEADKLTALLSGNETPYLRVLNGRYRGIALLAAGRFSSAISELESTLDFSRRYRAGREMESQLLAALSEAKAKHIASPGIQLDVAETSDTT